MAFLQWGCKMTKLIASLIASIGLSLAAPAYSQNKAYGMQTGNDALTACQAGDRDQSSQDFTLAIACLSWINGAVQTAEPTDRSTPLKPSYCTPESGGSTGQYKDVFVAFLRNNPAIRHQPAIFLFHQAMASAFPCTD